MNRIIPLQNYFYYCIVGIGIALLTTSFSGYSQLSFTNVAASKNVRISTVAKDGGFTWADFNNDGYKDLLVNTNSNSSYSRLLFNDGAPNFNFTDVTLSKAPSLLLNITERSAVAGDIDNDGDIDFVRNSSPLIEVYKNSGAPNYIFTLSQSFTPLYFTSGGTQTGLNSEGMGLIDFDGDGDLDLFVEDHEYGVDLMINNGSGVFSHYSTNASPRGLGTTGASGDYSLVADLNNDGYVDILARREGTSNNNNQTDLFFNNGNGTFSSSNSVNLNAFNSNKGGVAAGDFDGDGDLDYFWTDNGGSGAAANNCYLAEHTGTNTGVFAIATVTITGASSSLPSSGAIDGVTIGDVDHDGKLDIFLTANSGPSILLINTSTGVGVFSFNHNNYGINVNGDGEGCEFVDYDNDGDLDLYINVNGGYNQLWENNLNDTKYVNVVPVIDIGGGVTRPAIGATVILRDCSGNRISPIMEVNGGSGHGTQLSTVIHFGLPAGELTVYYAEVSFVRPNGGTRTVVTKQIYLGLLDKQTITIADTESSDPISCIVLSTPGLLNFTVENDDQGNIIKWEVAADASFRSYEIQYSRSMEQFTSVGMVENSSAKNYLFTHNNNDDGVVYYRLKINHPDNKVSYSKIVAVKNEKKNIIFQKPYPNPFVNTISANISLEKEESITIHLFDLSGKMLKTEMRYGIKGNNLVTISKLDQLSKGIYLLRITAGNSTVTERIIK